MKDETKTNVEMREDGRVTIPEPTRTTLGLDGGETLEIEIRVVERDDD